MPLLDDLMPEVAPEPAPAPVPLEVDAVPLQGGLLDDIVAEGLVAQRDHAEAERIRLLGPPPTLFENLGSGLQSGMEGHEAVLAGLNASTVGSDPGAAHAADMRTSMATREADAARRDQGAFSGEVERGLGRFLADLPLLLTGGGAASGLARPAAQLLTVGAPFGVRTTAEELQTGAGPIEALTRGAIETVIPALFGRTGLERAVLSRGREAVVRELAGGISNHARRLGIQAAAEGAEESATELAQVLVDVAMGEDPGDVARRLSVSGAVGSLVGGGANVPQAVAQEAGPALLAARLATAQPAMGAATQPTEQAASAEQELAEDLPAALQALADLRGMPAEVAALAAQDSTPLQRRPDMPEGMTAILQGETPQQAAARRRGEDETRLDLPLLPDPEREGADGREDTELGAAAVRRPVASAPRRDDPAADLSPWEDQELPPATPVDQRDSGPVAAAAPPDGPAATPPVEERDAARGDDAAAAPAAGGPPSSTGPAAGEPAAPVPMEFEQFAAQRGASRADIGDAGAHKRSPRQTDRQWARIVDALDAKAGEVVERRATLRQEYQSLIEQGVLREPTRLERLETRAEGHADNPSVQAARRILINRHGFAPDYWDAAPTIQDSLQVGPREVEILRGPRRGQRAQIESTRPDGRLLLRLPDGRRMGQRAGVDPTMVRALDTEPAVEPMGAVASDQATLFAPDRIPGEDAAPAVVAVPVDALGAGLDLRETRRAARQWAFANLEGRTVAHPSGITVTFNRQGLKHATDARHRQETLHAITRAPEILAAARYRGAVQDQRARPDVVAVHHFDGRVQLGDGPVRTARIVVRETRQGQFFYDQFLMKQAPDPVPPGGLAEGDPIQSRPAEPGARAADPSSAETEGTRQSPPEAEDDGETLQGPERIPGEGTPATVTIDAEAEPELLEAPDPEAGIESLIVWALRKREEVIADLERRVARGGGLVEEYRETLAEWQSVAPEVLAEDMRRFPQHYLRHASSLGSRMHPLALYKQRIEMPPIEPRVQPSPLPPGPEPVSLMGTLQQLREDLRTVSEAAPTFAVDAGAVREGAAGHFNTRTQGITTRYHNDLDLVAHEVGHWASETWDLLPPVTAGEMRAELARLAVHGSAGKGDTAQREGMAEWFRAWMIAPAEAQQRAPEFSQHVLELVPQKVLGALRAYGNAVRRFEGSPAIQQMQAGTRRTTEALAERRRAGRWWAPVKDIIVDWLGRGNRETPARPGVIPRGWGADQRLMDRLRFQLSDKEAPQRANWLLALTLVGMDPDRVSPSASWDIQRKALRGIQAKIRDGVARHGLPNLDGSAAVDGQTGEAMALPWLLEPALQQEDFGAFLDKAHAFGSAQRTLELADRFTEEAEREIHAYRNQLLATVGKDEFRRGVALDKADEFAKQRRLDLRRQLARLTAAGGGLRSATEVAERTLSEATSDPDRPAMEEYLRRYRAWSDWNLQYAVETEMLSPQVAHQIRQGNQYYIDWHRVFADEDGPVNLGEAVKGSSRTIHNPLASLLHATWSTITRGDRNRLMETFVAPLRAHPTRQTGRSLASLGHTISDEAWERAKEQSGFVDDGAGGKQRVYHVQRLRQKVDEDGAPVTQEDGTPVQEVVTEHWVFDPATEASMEAMRAYGGHDAWTRFTQGLVNLQRLTITSAPSFRARVPIRDSIERLMNTAAGSTIADTGRGLRRTLTDPLTGEQLDLDQLYSQSGASMAGWNQRTRDQALGDVLDHVEDMRKGGWKWVSVGGLWRAWQKVGEKAEDLARRAEYVAAYRQARKERGYSQQDAALYAMTQARGLLDTSESGRLIGALNRWFLFLNAAVQGSRRTAQLSRASIAAFRKGDTALGMRLGRTVLVRMGMLGMTFAGMRMLALVLSDEDEQEELLTLPAWKRDFNMVLPDFGLGKIAIAKPYEWGFIGSGFERLADAAFAQYKAEQAENPADQRRWREHGERSFEEWGNSGLTALSPLRFDDLLGGGLAPIAEVAFNRALFTGGTIIPGHEEHKRLELRSRAEEGSPFGQALSTVLAPLVGDQFGDPRAIDHVLRGYLGGWGSSLTSQNMGEVVWRLTGARGDVSPFSGRDVRWVLDWASENGMAARKPFADLRRLALQARDAEDDERRVALLRSLRRRAANLRRGIEGGTISPRQVTIR